MNEDESSNGRNKSTPQHPPSTGCSKSTSPPPPPPPSSGRSKNSTPTPPPPSSRSSKNSTPLPTILPKLPSPLTDDAHINREPNRYHERKTVGQCEICHSSCKSFEEPFCGSGKVRCFECQAQKRLPPRDHLDKSSKLKRNLIYDKLENFYSTFKLKKKIAMQQQWLNEAPTKSCKVQRLQCMENTSRQLLWKFGGKLVDHPVMIIAIPLLFCALASVGVIIRRKNLEFQTPFSLLYSQSAEEISVRTTFNFTNPKYNAFDRFSSSQFAVIMKTNGEDNILTDDTIEKYLRLKEKVEAVRLKMENGKSLKYDQICNQISRGSCTNDIMEVLVSMDKSMRLQYPETHVPASAKNKSSSLYLADKIGGVVVDQDGYLNSAESMALYFKLAPKFQREFEKWDGEFRRVMTNDNSNLKPMKFTWWSFGGFKKTFVELMYSIFNHLSWSVAVILLLLVLTFVKCSHSVSHPLLGITSAVIIVCSVASGISVDLGISGSMNPTAFPCYFLVAASIIFIVISLYQSWRKYSNFEINSKDKFRFLMCWEMPGFVNICILLCASFAMCAICTSLPLFQRTCQLMAACSSVMLVLVLVAYSGVLYLSGNRAKSGLKWYQMWPLKYKNHHDNQKYESKDVESLHKSLLNLPSNAWCATIEMLCSGWFRYVSFLLFIVYVIFAVWGCSIADVSFNEDHYLRQNDNLHEFLLDYSHYYGTYSSYMELIYDGPVDYYNPKIRRAIGDMLSYVEFDMRASDKIVSWLKDFNEFEQTVTHLINKDSFVPLVNLVFLRDQRYKMYISDIQTNPNGDQIVATRMYIRLNDNGLDRRVEIAKNLLSQANSFNLPLKIKSPTSFLLAHDVEIEWNSVQTFLILILMLCVFSLILFAQPFLTLVLVICIISSSVGAVGYAAFWGVPANALSISTILAGTMFTCFVCSMFCYLYNNANECGPMQRLFYSFQSVFRGVLWSNAITVACFLPLLTIESEYVVQQMKLILCQLVISSLHCLLFLPTLLHFYNSNVTAFCRFIMQNVKNVCQRRDFTKHVYYVPMSQRKLIVDPLYVQRFFKQKFREDITLTGSAPMDPFMAPREIMQTPEHQSRALPEVHQSPMGVPMKPQSKVYRYSSKSMDPMEDFIRSRGRGPNMKPRPQINGCSGWSPKTQMVPEPCSSPESSTKLPSSDDDPCLYDEPLALQKIKSRSRSADSSKRPSLGENWEKPKNKLSYSKWTKEIPIGGRRMERVVAERYTLEADGDDVNLQKKWEKFLKRQGDRAPFVPHGQAPLIPHGRSSFVPQRRAPYVPTGRPPYVSQEDVVRVHKLHRGPYPVHNGPLYQRPFGTDQIHSMKNHGIPPFHFQPNSAKIHEGFTPSFHQGMPPASQGRRSSTIIKKSLPNLSNMPSSAWY